MTATFPGKENQRILTNVNDSKWRLTRLLKINDSFGIAVFRRDS